MKTKYASVSITLKRVHKKKKKFNIFVKLGIETACFVQILLRFLSFIQWFSPNITKILRSGKNTFKILQLSISIRIQN